MIATGGSGRLKVFTNIGTKSGETMGFQSGMIYTSFSIILDLIETNFINPQKEVV